MLQRLKSLSRAFQASAGPRLFRQTRVGFQENILLKSFHIQTDKYMDMYNKSVENILKQEILPDIKQISLKAKNQKKARDVTEKAE